MSRNARRSELAVALRHYHGERAECDARMSLLRERVRALPPAWLIGGGFAGGMAAGLLPVRSLLRGGGVAMEMVALMLRAPYAHQIAAAIRKGWNSAGRSSGATAETGRTTGDH